MKVERAATILAGCALWFCGCATTYREGLPPGMTGVTPAPSAKPDFERLEREGERNWVLNLDYLALTSLRAEDRETAKRALDEAILNIDAIFSDSEAAARARSLWWKESTKVFKGDPYERAMTYFYRAVLYMQDKDWENARALLRSAALQDAFAEEAQDRSDWVSFELLTAACEVQLRRPDAVADAAARALENASRVRTRYDAILEERGKHEERGWSIGARLRGLDGLTTATLPACGLRDNLLVVATAGSAPEKYVRGENKEQLLVRPGNYGGASTTVSIDGRAVGSARLVDSLYFQAATRGGREIDGILENKALFKETTSTVGQGALIGGGIVALLADSGGDTGVRNAGLIAMAVGAVALIVSELVQPEADTRQWTTLPDSIQLLFVSVPPGEHEIAIGSGAPSGQTIFIPPPGRGVAVALLVSPHAVVLPEK